MLNAVADVADFQTIYANIPKLESFSRAAPEQCEVGSTPLLPLTLHLFHECIVFKHDVIPIGGE